MLKSAKDRFSKEGLLVLFSGVPSVGKTTVAAHLVDLVSKQYHKRAHFVSLDQWRQDNFGEKAFFDELIEVMLKRLNLELKRHVTNGELVILESGGYTALPRTKKIIVSDIKRVYEIRLECPLPLAIARDILRSIQGKEPRTKFVYIKSVINRMIGRREIVLFGFNRQLFAVEGLRISTVKHSPQQSARLIASFIKKTSGI